MRLVLPAEFWDEAERFAFRFCCEDCCYFDRQKERCVHGWPAADHRQATYDDRASRRELVFCKEFELV